jgi:hypothetical protein
MTEASEPLVDVVGPIAHADITDLATGLRFIQGRATGVPLSVAQEAVKDRRGYFIEGTYFRNAPHKEVQKQPS